MLCTIEPAFGLSLTRVWHVIRISLTMARGAFSVTLTSVTGHMTTVMSLTVARGAVSVTLTSVTGHMTTGMSLTVARGAVSVTLTSMTGHMTTGMSLTVARGAFSVSAPSCIWQHSAAASTWPGTGTTRLT